MILVTHTNMVGVAAGDRMAKMEVWAGGGVGGARSVEMAGWCVCCGRREGWKVARKGGVKKKRGGGGCPGYYR